ncbi:MAG: SDR family NAD(P)-dependent oxidoreductase [Actinobacteria bacterium]|nr:SDR family NAD(P)-dependent oxidoreductase [Actinomycetota bacterium]
MTDTIIWISGASSGIGSALAATVPWSEARLIDISRRGAPDAEHVEADLSDPSSWPVVAESFRRELEGFSGERVVFVHAAGTIQPIGYAGEVDTDEYTRNVILNSAASQVLGHAFLAAAKDVEANRQLLMLTSGAAKSVYPGWSSYGAAKAALDQWVRSVGAEQEERGGVRVAAVTPGTVDTGMQEQIRQTSERDFPKRQKFVDLHQRGELAGAENVAKGIWSLLDAGLENGAVVDLREVSAP